MGKKTIALDFDGVLHEYAGGWLGNFSNKLEPPTIGALDFVTKLLEKGFKLVIFSARASSVDGKLAIEKWLKDCHFPEIPVTDKKPKAALYVDDRGFRFEGNFKDVLDYIENANPNLGTWNQKGS